MLKQIFELNMGNLNFGQLTTLTTLILVTTLAMASDDEFEQRPTQNSLAQQGISNEDRDMVESRPVGITADMMQVTVPTTGGDVEIKRIQDNTHQLDGDWARTSRPCPSFCIQPMSPAEGVTTIGELELLEMLGDPQALVIDSRTYDWFREGTIPGSRSIPYDRILDELGELGCEPDFDGWDCANAKRVALFCNGLWCGQSPTAIRNMIAGGFPADRIFYYRGGMQSWRLLGLTVAGGD